MEEKKKFVFDVRVIVGFLIITAGVILLMDSLGYDLNINVWDFWPLILIAIGLKKILAHNGRKQYILGGFFILFGIIFQLRNLDIMYFTIRDIWPFFLIFIGIEIIRNGVFPGSRHNHSHSPRRKNEETISGDSINISAILGGGEYKYSSKKLNGGKISAIMGGCEIDLRNSDFEGKELQIEVFSLMGGIEIWIPQQWEVIVEVNPILGAIDNKTSTLNGSKNKVIIIGTVIMGGVDIKN